MRFKDSILLITVGIVCSMIAWMYWYWTGKYGDRIFIFAVTIALFLENIQLKRKLKRLENKGDIRKV